MGTLCKGAVREGSTMAPIADDLSVLKLAFCKIDKDMTGKISIGKFKEFIAELAGEEEAEACMEGVGGVLPDMFKHLDVDKDEMLTFEEVSKLAEYGSTSDLVNMLMSAAIYAADKDNNGWLTAAEMKGMLLCMAPPDQKDQVDEMVEMLMSMMASGDDGTKVRIDEVIKFMVKGEKNDDPAEKYRMMFRMMDINKDGFLSKKEFAKFMNMDDGISKAIVSMMLDDADKDGDGKLNYEELCAFLDK